jgi:soluble lytic murein transglycosylase
MIPGMPRATSERRAAALLWLGKSRDRLGDTAGRDSAWSEAIAADPTGYYSIRAAELAAGNTGLFTPPAGYDFAFNETAERAEAEAWLAAQLGVPDDGRLGELAPALLADGRWARGLELYRLAQVDLARAEFESLRKDHEADPLALYQLALAYRQLGLYRLASSSLNACLDQIVSNRLDVPVYFTRLRFGAYYADLIIPIAGFYGLDPLFLLSVIRQESAFEPFAGSSAGAQGLMQIIPSTGAEIAAAIGWPNYHEGDLRRPIVSINFGAYYLAEKIAEFDRDRFAALAGYNAGSGNSAAWAELAPGDPDLFLEVIRIKETETYLTFIYEIYEIYKGLYGR